MKYNGMSFQVYPVPELKSRVITFSQYVYPVGSGFLAGSDRTLELFYRKSDLGCEKNVCFIFH